MSWTDEDLERLQLMLDRFGPQWPMISLWMDRPWKGCVGAARDFALKWEKKTRKERYQVTPWSEEQLRSLYGEYANFAAHCELKYFQCFCNAISRAIRSNSSSGRSIRSIPSTGGALRNQQLNRLRNAA